MAVFQKYMVGVAGSGSAAQTAAIDSDSPSGALRGGPALHKLQLNHTLRD
jgi:hypothetical protein